MTAQGRTAWLTPTVYSFPAWLSRLREEYFLCVEDDRVPIDTQQSHLIWQSLIDREVFIGEPQVADLAMRSWRLIQDFELQTPAQWPALLLSEDSRRFKSWAAAYTAECDRRGVVDEWTFAGEIPGLVSAGQIPAPGAIELVGFDLPVTPLQSTILEAFAAAGAIVTRRKASSSEPERPVLVQFDEPDDELIGAARWARQRLEEHPEQTIAIVVPDLNQRVERTDRVFRQVFDPPSHVLQHAAPEPWHISLGKPLARWPMIADAMAILFMQQHRLSQPVANRLVRSPFLAGWRDEAGPRNQALIRLARGAPYDLTTHELIWLLQGAGATLLAESLNAWQQVRQESNSTAWPSDWAGLFQRELSSLGFAAGRALDSREYQTLRRWHDMLETFSTLDLVTTAPISRAEALSLLNQRALSAVFREQNPGAPVEILGVEEALGSHFDAMWVTTLDSNTWPGPPHRDPLIPSAIQSAVPRATSDGCLEQATLELSTLLASAPVTRGSFARGTDDAALEATALLADCARTVAEPTALPTPATMAAPVPDTQAPMLEHTTAKGGTGLLRDQSACPFRAFAQRRLHAVTTLPPRPGLDAAQRGTVVHKALENFWRVCGGSADLAALGLEDQQEHIRVAVAGALDDMISRFRLTLSAAGRTLEERRTERVLSSWLAVERQRGEFSVIAHEHEITLHLGGLTLSGKLDRLDRLADGTTILIDYKTGRTGKSDWFPEPRIADPQLPAYAIAVDPTPTAIAFARIRPDDLRFDGLAETNIDTPGVTALGGQRSRFKTFESWSELLQAWQVSLETLADDFIAGRAAVDPRKPAVCNTCHLHALCRIQERAPEDSMVEDSVDE
jgi:probable DNA repair protein